jgi:uncharacterized protein
MKKRFVLIAALATAACAMVGAQTPAPAGSPAGFKEIRWGDLVPKDWDPFKRYREKNVGALNDSDPRTADLMRDMRATWDNAPTVPAMDGTAVKLAGYVVPLDVVKGELKEFLLVPYFGACIHSPPPPANQIVHVVAAKPAKGFRAMDTVWVSGTLKTKRQDSHMGVSGYHLDATVVDAYVPPQRP